MSSISQQMIGSLQQFLQTAKDTVSQFAESPQAFTRERKLSFLTIITFQFSVLKKVFNPN
jgi:hypothetical protein